MIVRKFGVWSVARMYGTLLAVVGLIVGLMFALASLIGAGIAKNSDLPAGMAAVFGVGAVVLLPIFYGVLGILMGAVGATLYNLFAGMVGGVEIDVS